MVNIQIKETMKLYGLIIVEVLFAMVFNGKKIVTLCGSTRFKDIYDELNAEYTKGGIIVLSCGWWDHKNPDGSEKDEEFKELMDDLHLVKIELSDFIYVINKDGYVGKSTIKEILHAIKHGKKIIYHEPGHVIVETNSGGYTNYKCLKCNIEVGQRKTLELMDCAYCV